MKNKTNKITDLSDDVMEEIQDKHLVMRPKAYFVIGSILLAIGIVGLTVTVIFFLNIVLFKLHTHAPFGYLWFGSSGFRPFLMSFPWMPVFIGLAGVFGGIILLKKYDIAYKHSFRILVGGLFVFTVVGAVLLNLTDWNERLERQVVSLHSIYNPRYFEQGLVVGEVVEMRDGRLFLITPLDDEVEVDWSEGTVFPPGVRLKVGDRIQAIGEIKDGVFVAEGISVGGMFWKRFPPENDQPPFPMNFPPRP